MILASKYIPKFKHWNSYIYREREKERERERERDREREREKERENFIVGYIHTKSGDVNKLKAVIGLHVLIAVIG